MLVLARKKSEEVIISLPCGDKIIVRICKIRRDTCKIAFDAAPSVRIIRRELNQSA